MKYYKDFKPVDLDLIAFMETYKKEGTDGIEELTQLQMLIGHCTIEQIWKMIDYNTEVAVEILINCKGNTDALGMYEDYLTQHCGWVTADNYNEVCKKYDARVRKAQEECDEMRRQRDEYETKLHNAVNNANDSDDEVRRLKNEIIRLKARLFDAYEAGYSDDKENF